MPGRLIADHHDPSSRGADRRSGAGLRGRCCSRAVVLLLEEWLWHGTAEFLRELSRLPPVARCEDWIRRRTPYQALALFVLPILSLLPLKGVIVLAFAARPPRAGHRSC